MRADLIFLLSAASFLSGELFWSNLLVVPSASSVPFSLFKPSYYDDYLAFSFFRSCEIYDLLSLEVGTLEAVLAPDTHVLLPNDLDEITFYEPIAL